VIVLYGTGGEKLELRFDSRRGTGVLHQPFEGVAKNLERRYRESQSQSMRGISRSACPRLPARSAAGAD
jgi:excinuclease ABC subunit A